MWREKNAAELHGRKKTLMKVMDGDDKETGSYEETKRDTSNRLELAVASPSPESKQIKRPLQITHSIWHRMGNGKWQPAPYRGLCGVCARVWVCDCARNKEARVWTRLPASFFSTGPTESTLRWFFPFSVLCNQTHTNVILEACAVTFDCALLVCCSKCSDVCYSLI